MKLSKVERWTLSNQFRILEMLEKDEDQRAYWNRGREAIERGYTSEYPRYADHLFDELGDESCRFVRSVLEMYDFIQRAHDDLGAGSGMTAQQTKFPGFDGNNESEYVAYCRFLRSTEQWDFLHVENDRLNSHRRMRERYHAMLDRYAQSADRHSLTRDDLERIFATAAET